jgi:hypothetical protein
MKMKMQVLTVDGQMWLVYEALSEKDALDEIAHARCLGSIGGTTTLSNIDKTETVIAKVRKIKLVEPS